MTADVLEKGAQSSQDSSGENKLEAQRYTLLSRKLWTPQQCGLTTFTMHLLYESLKLQERFWNLLEPIARLNLQLCKSMKWSEYVRYYSTCLCVMEPDDFVKNDDKCMGNQHTRTSFVFRRFLPEALLLERFIFHANSSTAAVLNGSPPLIYTILHRVLEGKARVSGGWPAIRGISSHSPLSTANRLFFVLVDCFDAVQPNPSLSENWWFLLCKGLLEYNIDPKFVASQLCVGVGQPIERALRIAKDHLDDMWDDDFNILIGRLDRVKHVQTFKQCLHPAEDVIRAAQERAIGREYRATLNDDDGVIMRPDFPKHWGDSRLDIVQTMFNTAAPIPIPCNADGGDAVYQSLRNLSRRATALPVGRGMFTLCTQNFRGRDSVPIPRLNLEGRTRDTVIIKNDFEEALPVNNIWPLFHNGCAAGLRFLSLPRFKGRHSAEEEESATRHWVLYQTRNIACPASRSGLLLAAGLLGHLKVLQRTDIYSLLVSPQSQFSGREAITIAVMLGLSCSLRGTSNDVVFNCVSMHVQSLTPATEDIEVSLDVQTAAFVSIGLLYQGSPDAFLVEMLLIQMSRLPSDEHFRDREGYALGAAFGLGLLLLGRGSGHGVPNVENRLLKFMEGARREAAPSAREGLEIFNEVNPDRGYFLTRAQMAHCMKESFRNHSTRIYEGDYFNIAVSGPAAVVALGFIYLQTEDASMAEKLKPPNRLVGLQGVFPELCLLRTMMSSLVMWSKVEPTQEWLHRSIPPCLLNLAKSPRKSGLVPSQIRYLTMNLGYCLAGAVLALGMRFAGSLNADAKATVLAELNGFLQGYIGTTKADITAIQRSTGAFLPCISACAVSLSLITAGTGDVQCLSVMQKLYRRTNVKYGDHLAISMATGLLFLGGGQLTLSNTLPSVAALIMAFYPVWPETASDNKMHLQALRHLYCLAVVPRLIETVDVLTNRPVSIPVRVIVNRGRLCQNEASSVVKEMWTPIPKGREDQAVRMVTPCLLPDVSTVSQIEVRSAQHYSMTIFNAEPTVICDGGIVLRVLEKNVSSTEDGKCGRSPGEELVVSWIRHLFHDQLQRRPRPIEAGVIIDNMNLLLTCQEKFLNGFRDTEREFSLDFVMNVRRTLEKRYSGLLRREGKFSANHPLFHLVIKQKSVHSTAVALLDVLTKGNKPLSDIDPVAQSLLSFGEANVNEVAGENGPFDVSLVKHWLVQALHFYGLIGGTKPLSQALEKYRTLLSARGKRMYALYNMNQSLLLRPRVLEDLVERCVDYVE
uniref:Putative cyclosome subunit 1 n=1 Tax=Trypanosoma congolense (strain IL3000) TaxID=1068625 RepID=G0UNS5_TRYCI|nr:putative cyclosome subunit 1 [Trypanosoma congolense IL3000]